MSSSWTERQGQVGDLRNRSKEELQELLHRQEQLLSNLRLIQTLPDKGKKIKEFVEKVRLAIQHQDEEERRQSLALAAKTDFESKYRWAFTMQQHAVLNTPTDSLQNKQRDAAAGDALQERDPVPASPHVQENSGLDKKQDQVVSREAADVTMEMAAAVGASLNSDDTKEGDLVEALERVRLSESNTCSSSKSVHSVNSVGRNNDFFRKQSPKNPHYLTVLEKTEKIPVSRKPQFKTNQLPHRGDISPVGSPLSRSFEGSSPLSAQARTERDRKHLDDITAATLPPLHHSPARLLTLEESASLLKEQTRKQNELQAKLAAQKLSEGLKISMGSYTPDSGPMATYREVHDEGALLSSEED